MFPLGISTVNSLLTECSGDLKKKKNGGLITTHISVVCLCDDLNAWLAFGWLVVLRFNATLTAKAISWLSVALMCFLAFSHQY